MATFINKNYKTRDYEGTNVVCCIAEVAPDENWVPADESAIKSNMTQLWIEGYGPTEKRYFGYLLSLIHV